MKTHFMTPEQVRLPHRDREAHKGDFGRVTVVGGCVGYTGAPVLSAGAALRTGSGLVTVLVPEQVWPVAAAKLTCAMPRPLPSADGRRLSEASVAPALEWCQSQDAVALGPGLGREGDTPAAARRLAEAIPCPLVLDADGINALSGHIDVLDSRKGRLTVLTPHDGEFARLTGALPGEDRAECARAFSAEHGCVLVLKGHRTVTAFPDGEVFLNTTGNPGMAKGGSGDVLTGMILSLLGQGMEPRQAVPWAVCLHGQAGDLAAEELGEYGMTPEDLVERLPAVLKKF